MITKNPRKLVVPEGFEEAKRLRVTHIVSELSPLAQTGGLGDMVASLGKALRRQDVDSLILLPKYQTISAKGFSKLPLEIKVPAGSRKMVAHLWTGEGKEGVGVGLIDIPEFFDRPGLYGEPGQDYPDNCLRFSGFGRAALEVLKAMRHASDVIHVHDWHAALVPVYLQTLYSRDPFFEKTRTLLTIHNMAHQGIFPFEDLVVTGLPREVYSPQCLEYYSKINFLKGGIVCADEVTTVSPTYALEVLTPEFGCGLEGVLEDRKSDFRGILNGIDTEEWDPATDPHIDSNYSTAKIGGKRACKRALQEEMKLPERPKTPLFGMVSRLTDQKGMDVALTVIESMIDEDLQWVILGAGDPLLENDLCRLAEKFPEKVSVSIGFNFPLAHRIEAGCDFFVIPSRYEPCGYNQMYSQRYGTIPVVRATGGLADTVIDGETGISFRELNAQELEAAIRRALGFYRNVKERRAFQTRLMKLDLSWDRPGTSYLEVYRRLRSSDSASNSTISFV